MQSRVKIEEENLKVFSTAIQQAISGADAAYNKETSPNFMLP